MMAPILQAAAIRPGGLVFDDAQILRLGNEWISVVIQLQYFAFGHLAARFRQDFVDPLIAKADDMADRLGIEVIADENADLIAPHLARRLTAASQVGVIDDIVMQERGGMNKLDETGEDKRVFSGIAAETGAQGQQQRSNTFATAT